MRGTLKRLNRTSVAGLIVLSAAGLGLLFYAISTRLSSLTGSDSPEQPRVARLPAAKDFVGNARCAECHANIAERYARHPMAQSISRVSDWLAAEPLSAEVRFTSPAPAHFRVFVDEGRLMHEETREEDGVVVSHQAKPVSWIIGSGRRGRAFATADAEALRQSPIGWYAHDPHWDLSPGYDTPDQPRFQRRITTACLSCHAGRVAESGSNRFDSELPFLETAISCERCHGPGAAHVARHQQPAKSPQPDPIVNPAKLDPVRREAVCNRCHLSGGSRVLHAGLTDASFQPGQRLGDVWTILVDDVGKRGEVPAVSQVQQMRASRCFQASDGRLGCISCHDPHELPSEDRRIEFYRERCQSCHEPEKRDCTASRVLRQNRADDCIGCHLPQKLSLNVAHTAQSDHRILRRPEQVPAPSSELSSNSIAVWDEGPPQLDSTQVERAKQIFAANSDQSRSDIAVLVQACDVLQKVVTVDPEDGRAWEALSRAALHSNQPNRARDAGRRACQLLPDDDATWRVLAAAAIAAQDWSTANEALNKSLELVPDEAESWEFVAFVRMRQGRLPEARDAAQRAVELDPARPLPHAYLADALLQLQEPTEADRQFQLFRRLRTPARR